MQLKQFQVRNETSFSSRSGNALIALELSDDKIADGFRCGNLSIHESGDPVHSWPVRITPSGAVFCQDDDFYIALELFATMLDRSKDTENL